MVPGSRDRVRTGFLPRRRPQVVEREIDRGRFPTRWKWQPTRRFSRKPGDPPDWCRKLLRERWLWVFQSENGTHQGISFLNDFFLDVGYQQRWVLITLWLFPFLRFRTVHFRSPAVGLGAQRCHQRWMPSDAYDGWGYQCACIIIASGIRRSPGMVGYQNGQHIPLLVCHC